MNNIQSPEEPKRTGYQIMSSAVKKDFIPTEEEIKKINSFMFCRYLSSHPVGLAVASAINVASDLPIRVQYWFARSVMNNIRYLTYPKKSSEDDKNLEIIAKHYECNISIAKQYFKILPKEKIDEILDIYRHIGRV